MQAESAHLRVSCSSELQAPCVPKSPHIPSLMGVLVAGFKEMGISSPIDATGSAKHQGLESWTLPGATPFGQYYLYDLQNLHLKLPWGL